MDPASAPTASGTRRLVVTVDGPGSSGKSSVGAAAAEQLGYRFFDTGLLYRAVTWLASRRAIPDHEVAGLVGLIDEVQLAADERGRLCHVLVDGARVERELHSPQVDGRVSAIAGIPEVRAALVGRQRAIAAEGGIVMAGRDIGRVILPDADLKIYLDASVEERAGRRAGERHLAPDDPARVELFESLRRRDEHDANRPVAPLRPAPDALILRTDGNTLSQTVALVVGAIRAAEARRHDAPQAPEGRPGDDSPVPERPAAPAIPARDRARSATPAGDPDGRAKRGLPVTPIAGHLTPLIRFVSAAARFVARAITRVRIEGDLSAIPRTGPVIVIANHASNADGVIISGFIPPLIGRRFNWLGKRELFDVPVLGWLALHGGIHAVERTAVDMEAFRIAQRILDAGLVLAVFPEGTRSRTGALQEAKDGLAMLAQRSGAPIVPIAIVDSDLVWPRGRKLPRFGGRIIIRVGRPFTLSADRVARGTARRDAKGAATRRMMGCIAALLPPRQRGVYADAVPSTDAEALAPDAASQP